MTTRKIGSDTWAFREQKLKDFIPSLGSLGFNCINLSSVSGTCSHVLPEHSSYRLEMVQRICQSNRLPVSAVHTGARLASVNRDDQEDGIDLIRRYVEMCKILSAGMIIIDLAGMGPDDTVDQVVRRTRSVLKECATIAGENGVALAIESDTEAAVSTAELDRKLIDAVDLPNLGANCNVGNISLSRRDPEGAIDILKGKILNVHLKDVTAGEGGLICCAVGEGDMDFSKILTRLIQTGYAGPLVIEYEGDSSPLAGVKRSLEHIQGILGKVDQKNA